MVNVEEFRAVVKERAPDECIGIHSNTRILDFPVQMRTSGEPRHPDPSDHLALLHDVVFFNLYL